MHEIDFVCAGINHQAWYLQFERNGKDAYPDIRAAVERPQVYNEEIVRNEMFLHLGYYVTESSGHNSEYNWWFRKRPDLIEKYCVHGTGWNPGRHRYILDEYLRREDTWKKGVEDWLNEKEVSLARGHEYAAYIVNAIMGGEPCEFNGNVPNTGLIPNLPDKACVEVPVMANRRGINPIHVGPLPPQLAALNNITIASEEMAVEGALTGDPQQVYYAIAYDPLTAAVLSLAEAKDMTRLLFDKNRDYLPQFGTVRL